MAFRKTYDWVREWGTPSWDLPHLLIRAMILGMALSTPCQTPETLFKTVISGNVICSVVELPFALNLGDEEAETLERNIHNALELVLAPFFR